jgi:hypothetical protein
LRVLVPATPSGLHPSVIPSILRSGWACQVIPMASVTSYWHALRGAWSACEDFAIVEHDIELRADELERFDFCAELWCAHSYEVYAGDIATAYGGPYGLGCVRFRKELLEAWPDAVDDAGELNLHPVHPQRSYAVMDSTLTQILRARVGEPHLHTPAVIHHHHYVREGAFHG